MTSNRSLNLMIQAQKTLRRLGHAGIRVAPFALVMGLVCACDQVEQEKSSYDLDFSKVSEADNDVIHESHTEHETSDAESFASTDETSQLKCTFEAPRVIEVINPVSVSNYALDTLGVQTAVSPDDACITQLLNDGAQILYRDESRAFAFYANRFESMLYDFSARIDVDAIEGRYDFEAKRLVPGIDGQKVDHAATRNAFFEAVKSGAPAFEIAIQTTHALSHDVSAYAGFEPKYRIGHYATHFSRAKNRTINVKLAASAMNGIFLVPGAEFSYNDWVGERSEARGFKEAPVIEQGQLVEGLGGGACQVSSTIHAAALLAGLGIEERYNHSLPSSYIPTGMDAVVSYPILDLRVKNTLSSPVVLKVTTQDDVLTAELYSNEQRSDRVLFRKEVVEEIPFKETITVDPTYEPGTIKIRKRGKVGYRVQRGRIFWKDGKETFEKLNADVYQSQPQQTSIAYDVVYPQP